jgi:hypothetical protein
MPSDTLEVVRGDFMLEDPWALPRGCSAVRLRRSSDGAAPRLATTVSAYYDDQYLNVVFSCADDHIEATMLDRDAPLYEEDVVEVFLAPAGISEYFEIEVSPRATVFDARIQSPDGVRETMTADSGWDCPGLLAGVRRLVEAGGTVSIDTTIRIPFRGLDRGVPLEGEIWRANFFRVDRHPAAGDEYTSWRPTMKDPPDFHVAAAFGSLVFRS